MPSARAWCILVISAVPPSASPSIRVISHSGLARSKSDIAASRPISSTASRVPGCGAVTRRMWKPRSNSGQSAQRGGAGRGEDTIRWRKVGSRRLSPSNRSTNSSQSGVLSNREIVTMVDRKTGSLSIAHRKASVFCMNSLIVFILRRDRVFGIDSDDTL